MTPQDMVPKDKFDDRNVELLKLATNELVAPILGDLVQWLQDLNWPVAQKLINVLPRFQFDLIPYIIEVLHSNDDMWKNGVLQFVEKFEKESAFLLYSEIRRISNEPTMSEIMEDTPYYANRVIKKFDF